MLYVFTERYGTVTVDADYFSYSTTEEGWSFYKNEGVRVVAFFRGVTQILNQEDYDRGFNAFKNKYISDFTNVPKYTLHILRCNNDEHCDKYPCKCHVGCSFDLENRTDPAQSPTS